MSARAGSHLEAEGEGSTSLLMCLCGSIQFLAAVRFTALCFFKISKGREKDNGESCYQDGVLLSGSMTAFAVFHWLEASYKSFPLSDDPKM